MVGNSLSAAWKLAVSQKFMVRCKHTLTACASHTRIKMAFTGLFPSCKCVEMEWLEWRINSVCAGGTAALNEIIIERKETTHP